MSNKSKHPHPHHEQNKGKTGLHKSWITWTVVVLMLAGMAMYIMSDDESLGPGGEPMEAIGGE